jgi:hypothetical protein
MQLTIAIKNSELRENIVELNDLLSRHRNRSIQSLTSDLKRELHFEELLSANIDLYFPVAKHRETFYRGSDLLILPYPNWIAEEQINILTAYDLSGKPVFLTANAPPETPVLVIAICEHDGVGHALESTENMGLNDCELNSRRLIIDETHVFDTNELWPGGRPEIEVRMRVIDNGGWEHTNLDFITARIDVDNCEDMDVYFDRTPLSPSIDETKIYQLYVYEEDRWPNPDDLMFSWDIDIDQVFLGPGVTNRMLFTDGSRCDMKDIEFWLFWE